MQPFRGGRGSSGDILRSVLLAAGSILVALAISELVVRALPTGILGYVYSDGAFKTPPEFTLDPTVNSLGFHDAEPMPRDPVVRRVLLLGDSFVAGLSVSVPEVVGQRLAAYLRARGGAWEVVSIGQSGWGQRQELAALEQRIDALRPDVVVCMFLPFNDVRDNSPELTKREKVEYLRFSLNQLNGFRPGWFSRTVAEVPGLVFPWSALNRLVSQRLALARQRKDGEIPLDYFVYAVPPDASWEAGWHMTEGLIRRMKDVCAAHGARFVLASASTPHGVLGAQAGLERLFDTYPAMRALHWDLDAPNARLAALCDRESIPFLSLEPPFREATGRGARLHWRFDGHWNPAGNDFAGSLLAGFVHDLR